jgi:hypothetical protein
MLVAGVAGGAGCKGKGATEVIPGVSSQMVVPKDLAAIQIEVEANGVPAFCQFYEVMTGGTVQLPSTLGVIPDRTPDTVVTITIRGYDQPGMTGNDATMCLRSAIDDATNMGARIIRRSIQKFVDEKILFLPMPLSYSCQDVDCSMMGSTYACKGGLCLDSTLEDSSTLAEFDPTLIDGTGICFSPKMCFADVVPATLLDPENCVYGFPGLDPAAGTGVNVRVDYKDITWQRSPAGVWEQVLAGAGEEEILNEDSTEGFTVVSAADAGLPEAGPSIPGLDAGPRFDAKAPLIKLARGLCALSKAATSPPPHPTSGTMPVTYHTISDVQIASACPPKELLLPICATERKNTAILPDGGPTTDGRCNVAIPMDPAPSAMYLVMDQSVYMHGAYGASGSAQALALSLSDPVFKQTFAGFKFLNDPTEADCTALTTSYGTPDLPACMTPAACTFALAGDVQPLIAGKLNGWIPSESPGGQCGPAMMGTGIGGCSPSQFCFNQQCFNPNALDLQAAMRPEGAYAQVQSFLAQSQIVTPNIAGVMFIVNRAPVSGPVTVPGDATDCGGTAATKLLPGDVSIDATLMPGDCGSVSTAACNAQTVLENEALNAFTANGLQTYFVVLDNDDGSTEAINYFTQIASDIPQAVTTLDATMLSGSPTSAGAMNDVSSFLNSVVQLGTCLYQLPPDVAPGSPPAGIQVSFSLPSLGAPLTIVPAADPTTPCTAASEASASPPDGWSYEAPGRIRICGPSCDTLRMETTIAAAARSPVPVNIMNLCSGTTSGTTGDGGSASQAGADGGAAGMTVDASFGGDGMSPTTGDAANASGG